MPRRKRWPPLPHPFGGNPSARGVQEKLRGGERDILGQFSFTNMQISGTSAGKSEHLVERAQSGENEAPNAKGGHPLQDRSGEERAGREERRTGGRGRRPQTQFPGAAAMDSASSRPR